MRTHEDFNFVFAAMEVKTVSLLLTLAIAISLTATRVEASSLGNIYGMSVKSEGEPCFDTYMGCNSGCGCSKFHEVQGSQIGCCYNCLYCYYDCVQTGVLNLCNDGGMRKG